MLRSAPSPAPVSLPLRRIRAAIWPAAVRPCCGASRSTRAVICRRRRRAPKACCSATLTLWASVKARRCRRSAILSRLSLRVTCACGSGLMQLLASYNRKRFATPRRAPNHMTVLVFTPTIGDQMRAETRASIAAQKTEIPFVWEVSAHNPLWGKKVANVGAQYQRARSLCLAGNYDALLTVEDDMVIPPDALEKLWHTDAPVVYGVYLLRHGTPALNTWQYLDNKNLGMTLSLYPNELRKYWRQGWGQVSGVGWGCTLIRRQVLERIAIHNRCGR